ncbi:hypothetical protein QBC42DRAFT_321045 [Cladorrhinum samala]|uniref:Copper-fist domain-containing protein n=1 Tax=Cladorrhinum samala TaxID=585594 RepID=A0AAV9HYX7_9PEZI|nr:hypothetical protein QBC42DRAFT_321045 [Cladorrhinum samala]
MSSLFKGLLPDPGPTPIGRGETPTEPYYENCQCWARNGRDGCAAGPSADGGVGRRPVRGCSGRKKAGEVSGQRLFCAACVLARCPHPDRPGLVPIQRQSKSLCKCKENEGLGCKAKTRCKGDKKRAAGDCCHECEKVKCDSLLPWECDCVRRSDGKMPDDPLTACETRHSLTSWKCRLMQDKGPGLDCGQCVRVQCRERHAKNISAGLSSSGLFPGLGSSQGESRRRATVSNLEPTGQSSVKNILEAGAPFGGKVATNSLFSSGFYAQAPDSVGRFGSIKASDVASQHSSNEIYNADSLIDWQEGSAPRRSQSPRGRIVSPGPNQNPWDMTSIQASLPGTPQSRPSDMPSRAVSITSFIREFGFGSGSRPQSRTGSVVNAASPAAQAGSSRPGSTYGSIARSSPFQTAQPNIPGWLEDVDKSMPQREPRGELNWNTTSQRGSVLPSLQPGPAQSTARKRIHRADSSSVFFAAASEAESGQKKDKGQGLGVSKRVRRG